MNTIATTSGSPPVREVEIYKLAQTWFECLDVHAPLEEFMPLLADEGLKMVFPETTVAGFKGFKTWYERVIRLFFDEVHTLEEVKLLPKGDRVEVKIVVRWEASRWNAPAPRSERIIADAYQTWEIVRSPITDQPVILTYIVDSLSYDEGSAKL